MYFLPSTSMVVCMPQHLCHNLSSSSWGGCPSAVRLLTLFFLAGLDDSHSCSWSVYIMIDLCFILIYMLQVKKYTVKSAWQVCVIVWIVPSLHAGLCGTLGRCSNPSVLWSHIWADRWCRTCTLRANKTETSCASQYFFAVQIFWFWDTPTPGHFWSVQRLCVSTHHANWSRKQVWCQMQVIPVRSIQVLWWIRSYD